MDLRKLKSLVAVAELGSISAASDAVNLTQSAVSQQLKDLECDLELQLIDRSERPVKLTAEGAELVSVARQMLKQWNDFKDRYRETEFTGMLVLGYVRSALTAAVATALISLKENHQQLAIKLISTGGVSKHLAQDVAEGKIDASFGVGPLNVPKGVLWKAYCRERYYVVAPKHAIGRTDEELLSKGPYLRFVPYLLAETKIDRELHRRGIKIEAAMELDSYESILLMVEHELGIGIVPEPYLSKSRIDKLHCVPLGTPPLTRQMGIMVRHDNPQKRLVDLLWNALKNFSNEQLMNSTLRMGTQMP